MTTTPWDLFRHRHFRRPLFKQLVPTRTLPLGSAATAATGNFAAFVMDGVHPTRRNNGWNPPLVKATVFGFWPGRGPTLPKAPGIGHRPPPGVPFKAPPAAPAAPPVPFKAAPTATTPAAVDRWLDEFVGPGPPTNQDSKATAPRSLQRHSNIQPARAEGQSATAAA